MQYYNQPNITPKTTTGGGDARPPYLQMRQPVAQRPVPGYPGQQTQPVVTPKSTAVPGEVKQQMPQPQGTIGANPTAPKPPQAGGNSLADVYKFFQSDLENQKNQALAGSRSDAAARGVFYGTPLTGSEADINTQYLRGLGQLQAGMYGNEQQNVNTRLGLATQLFGMGAAGQPNVPGLDLSSLGAIFGSSPAVAGARSGPTGQPPITPNVGTDVKGPPKRKPEAQ